MEEMPKAVGYLYEREVSDIRHPIYMTSKNQLYFIDNTRHKLVQIMMPLFYDITLALNYNNLTIVLDWSETYDEYIANSNKGFPFIKINGNIVKNKTNDNPETYIITYRDSTTTLLNNKMPQSQHDMPQSQHDMPQSQQCVQEQPKGYLATIIDKIWPNTTSLSTEDII